MEFPFKTKICGVTTADDAIMVASSGADAIGLNFFAAGKRYIDPARAKIVVDTVIETHSEFVVVGVFVNESAEAILETVKTVGLMTVQLHGDEEPELVPALKKLGKAAGLDFDVIRAIRTAPHSETAALDLAGVTAEAQKWMKAGVDALLIDAATPDEYGGTGKQVDWKGFSEIDVCVPVLLAGGLNPDNVAKAISIACPYGVDVASGVESSPGKKSSDKTFAFVKAAQELLSVQ
jgi:phosphoribosylanthranilate isomerase